METKELFNRLLHLPEEWEVYEVTYEETQQQIHEKINRVMSNSVERGLARRELSSEKIISINIDEKSYKKGHNYITVISQQTRNRVLEVGKERTLEATESLLNTTIAEKSKVCDVEKIRKLN